MCRILNISRQGYYKSLCSAGKKELNETMIRAMVIEIRRRMPRVGSKKLYRMLKKDISLMGIRLGRDKFLQILRRNGLLVERRRKYVRTTNSSHRFRIYENLISGIEPSRPDEIYVADITYLRSEEGFSYLSLVTDLYSRKIVGYAVSLSLSLEGSLKALKMSIDGKELKGLTHHSDRGLQYCSNVYTEILTRRGIKISMSEKGNPYENAVAERVNGILKEEFGLGGTYKTRKQAEEAVKEAIKTYNEYRPHMSIGYKTPNEKYAA